MTEIAESALALRLLKEATDGLLYPSESDEVFALVHLPPAISVPTVGDVCQSVGLEVSTVATETDLDRLFAGPTTDAAWHGEDEKRDVNRFRALRSIFTDRLTETKVFRVGEIRVHLFIIGKTSGGRWVGVRTVAIET